MTHRPKVVCGLLTQDPALARRLSAVLSDLALLRCFPGEVPAPEALGLWIVDLRARAAWDFIAQLQHATPAPTLIACGVPRSEPWHKAQHMGLYAVVNIELEPDGWIDLFRRASERAALLAELSELRTSSSAQPIPTGGDSPARSAAHAFTLSVFPAALCSYEDVRFALQSLVEGVARCAHTPRAGLFSLSPQRSDCYTLRASLRPLAGTEHWTANKDHIIPQWLARSLQYVTRPGLAHITNRAVRDALAQALDDWGAEVIIPLQLRSELAGWLFLGGRVTGAPFDDEALLSLTPVADHAATVLDNVLLYEAAAWRRALVEALLQSMPTAVVAVDENGIVRTYNDAAATVFGRAAAEVINKPIETISSSLAGLLRTTLEGQTPKDPVEWTETGSRRQLSAVARLLFDGRSTLGAVAFVHDMTVERLLAGKQEQVERAAFWTELAAAMSHEVRNPLVAIKTFSQLLPERYLDADFRNEFSQTVQHEIGHLENIIEQIHQFANPPPLVWAEVSIPRIIQKAVEVSQAGAEASGIWVETSMADALPPIEGDENALAQCLAHLITNAAEALRGQVNPKVLVSAHPLVEGERVTGVLIAVQDNGPGIRPDIRSKVFSPFCTTKARGLGLGLPIAKRIVVDHGGQLDIETTERGTCVFIRLPSAKASRRNSIRSARKQSD